MLSDRSSGAAAAAATADPEDAEAFLAASARARAALRDGAALRTPPDSMGPPPPSPPQPPFERSRAWRAPASGRSPLTELCVTNPTLFRRILVAAGATDVGRYFRWSAVQESRGDLDNRELRVRHWSSLSEEGRDLFAAACQKGFGEQSAVFDLLVFDVLPESRAWWSRRSTANAAITHWCPSERAADLEQWRLRRDRELDERAREEEARPRPAAPPSRWPPPSPQEWADLEQWRLRRDRELDERLREEEARPRPAGPPSRRPPPPPPPQGAGDSSEDWAADAERRLQRLERDLGVLRVRMEEAFVQSRMWRAEIRGAAEAAAAEEETLMRGVELGGRRFAGRAGVTD